MWTERALDESLGSIRWTFSLCRGVHSFSIHSENALGSHTLFDQFEADGAIWLLEVTFDIIPSGSEGRHIS